MGDLCTYVSFGTRLPFGPGRWVSVCLLFAPKQWHGGWYTVGVQCVLALAFDLHRPQDGEKSRAALPSNLHCINQMQRPPGMSIVCLWGAQGPGCLGDASLCECSRIARLVGLYWHHHGFLVTL